MDGSSAAEDSEITEDRASSTQEPESKASSLGEVDVGEMSTTCSEEGTHPEPAQESCTEGSAPEGWTTSDNDRKPTAVHPSGAVDETKSPPDEGLDTSEAEDIAGLVAVQGPAEKSGYLEGPQGAGARYEGPNKSQGEEASEDADYIKESTTSAQSTAADFIGKLLNIQAEKNSVNFFMAEGERRLDEKMLELREMGSADPSWPRFRSSDLVPINRAESKSHIVLITCRQSGVAAGAAYSLVAEHYSQAEKKLLSLRGASTERVRNAGLDIDTFLEYSPGVGHDQVILIDPTKDSEHGRLLESFATTTVAHLKTMADELQRRKITVIGLVHGELLANIKLGRKSIEALITHWHLSIGHYEVVRAVFRGADELTRELSEELQRQRCLGRWPNNEDDLYEELLSFQTPGALKRELENREQKDLESDVCRQEFPREAGAEQWIVLVVIFFRRLSPANLLWLLARLLDSETAEVEKRSSIPNVFGELQEVAESVRRPVLEVLRENPDDILRKCGLESVPTESGERAIVFSTPGARASLLQQVNRHYPVLVLRLFDKLRASGLIFDPETPSKLVPQLIQTAAARAREDPGYYAEDWLRGSLLGMKHFLKVEVSENDDEMVVLSKLLRVLHNKTYWNHFCHRMSALIREMLSHDSLETTVRRFLHGLLSQREHESALEIVFFMARDLRSFHRFDLIFWMRQLIEQSPRRLEEETYRMLVRLASQSHVRIFEYLDGIREWLPDQGLERDRYSCAHHRSLQFMLDFCVATAERVEKEDFGAWPTPYPLFRAMQAEPELVRTRADQISAWMHHPTLLGVEDPSPSSASTTHHHSLAALLERWAWILEGIRPPSEAEPEAVALLDIWIVSFRSQAGHAGARAMRDYWHWKQEIYLRALRRTPYQDRTMRSQLMDMRKKVIELRKRFMRPE